MADLAFRPGTWDQTIWESVVGGSEYRLTTVFHQDDVILDIGAHIGGFTYHVLNRGCGLVIAVEPDPGNAQLFAHNILLACRACDRCLLVHAAVGSALCRNVPYNHCHVGANTGGGNTTGTRGTFWVPVVTLNSVMGLVEASRPIRLVKLDCEGSEWTILREADDTIFDRVMAWTGELHFTDRKAQEEWFIRRMSLAGYLVDVEYRSEGLSTFWAWKPGYELK